MTLEKLIEKLVDLKKSVGSDAEVVIEGFGEEYQVVRVWEGDKYPGGMTTTNPAVVLEMRER
jgi:hypothetical protein